MIFKLSFVKVPPNKLAFNTSHKNGSKLQDSYGIRTGFYPLHIFFTSLMISEVTP